MKHPIHSGYHKNQRGSAALLAIVTMLTLVILGLCGATLSLNARLMSSRKSRDVGVRAIAEAGVEYAYWQFIWNRTPLPFNETNRTFGEGSFSVRVVDNNAVAADSIQIVSTGTLRGASYTATKVFRSDQQSDSYSINPASTFLLFNRYGAVDSQRISLKALDIKEDDTIRLTVHGHWGPLSNPYSSTATDVVFSKDTRLLPPSSAIRIPGAIAANTPAYVTSFKDGSASDIPEDFLVTDTLDVVVPKGAKYLFTGTDYQDAVNISADGYSLEIKKLADAKGN